MASTVTELAQSHLHAPIIPADLQEESAQSIMMRYDGAQRNGEPVIFAVINIRDMAKLPPETMQGLNMTSRNDQGAMRSNPHAFYRKGVDGPSLYVDTETHDDFIDNMLEAARNKGLTVFSATGDIDLMRGPDGDIDPPAIPAFVENGFGPLPVRQAAEMTQALREEASGPEQVNDDENTPIHP